MSFIDTSTIEALPAPVWFILFFKTLGFVLHSALMNLWLAAFPIALWFIRRDRTEGKLWASRQLRQMPFIITFGVNFGIVPLLFIQVLYPRVFYPATILMAWFWILIIVLLVPAYYGAYVCAFGLPKNTQRLARWRYLFGALSALFFVLIGFIFTNGLTLVSRPDSWGEIWLSHSTAGASVGTGSALGEAILLPRFLLTLGLALGTTAAWALLDRALFMKEISPAYRQWSNRFALVLSLASILVYSSAFVWYLFAQKKEVVETLLGSAGLPFTLAAFASPFVLFVAVLLNVRLGAVRFPRLLGTLPFVVQIFSLGTNAIWRQGIQIRELSPWLPLSSMRVGGETWPAVLFLATFVVGVGVIVWMLFAAIRCRDVKN
ncbi:MAG: hypothetical protein Q4D38_14000 [Planctomycetia bacterium]|nr:hypothetical protein [Planctomycetia bacterium]